MPPLTADAPASGSRIGAAAAEARRGRGPADSYEDRSLYDRCITRGYPGSMMPSIYGNAYHIAQAPGYVAITYEMIHDTRIIPLDSRAHARAANFQLDMGDGRGHWEGDTLVVETTNFRDRSVYQNANPDTLKVTERFTRVSPRTVRWMVTIERSDDVDVAVDVLDAADQDETRAAGALRVPRGELRSEEHPECGACGRGARQDVRQHQIEHLNPRILALVRAAALTGMPEGRLMRNHVKDCDATAA